jgi:hypothetical protein
MRTPARALCLSHAPPYSELDEEQQFKPRSGQPLPDNVLALPECVWQSADTSGDIASQGMPASGFTLRLASANDTAAAIERMRGNVFTGGIASGKSTVRAEMQRLGAGVIDCDTLGHAAYAVGTPTLAHVIKEFGRSVGTNGNGINHTHLKKSL